MLYLAVSENYKDQCIKLATMACSSFRWFKIGHFATICLSLSANFLNQFALAAGTNSTCDHWKICKFLCFYRHKPKKSSWKLNVPTQREIIQCFVWEHQIFTNVYQVRIYKNAKSILQNFCKTTHACTGLKFVPNVTHSGGLEHALYGKFPSKVISSFVSKKLLVCFWIFLAQIYIYYSILSKWSHWKILLKIPLYFWLC